MQKVEKWRVEELALLLSEIAVLLKDGDNSEWANVFLHFHLESKNIILKEEFDLDSLKKLVRNIRNCFSGSSYFTNTLLRHENSEQRTRINQGFSLLTARLINVLKDLEKRSVEHTH